VRKREQLKRRATYQQRFEAMTTSATLAGRPS
jgi:hypothetical protein